MLADKQVFSWNRKLMGTFKEELKNKGEMADNMLKSEVWSEMMRMVGERNKESG